jgi:hypothetical protein
MDAWAASPGNKLDCVGMQGERRNNSEFDWSETKAAKRPQSLGRDRANCRKTYANIAHYQLVSKSKVCYGLVFERRENRWALVIYGAYYDESDERPGFSLAGYAAAYDTWVHLDWKWQCLLKKWNAGYFKASECENLLGEFAQYRDSPGDLKSALKPREHQKMVEIKTDFIDAICKHNDDLRGYGAAIVAADFERLIAEDVEAKRLFMEKPYYICFQLCLGAAAMRARAWNVRHSKEERVYIKPIFDSHKEYSGLAKPLFDEFVIKNPRAAEVLLPPDYEDDKSVSALQVADTLAYEARKLLTKRIRDPENAAVRMSMQRLRPGIERIYKLDYKNLKLIVHRQSPDKIPIRFVRVEQIW